MGTVVRALVYIQLNLALMVIEFTKVLNYSTSAMASVYTYSDKVFDMFVVLYEGSLLCYSLHAMVRAAEGQEDVRTLSRSAEQIDTGVMFFRLAVVQKRVLCKWKQFVFIRQGEVLSYSTVIYGSKRTLHSPSLTVLEAVDLSLRKQSPKRATNTLNSFRPFGEVSPFAFKLLRNVSYAFRLAWLYRQRCIRRRPSDAQHCRCHAGWDGYS